MPPSLAARLNRPEYLFNPRAVLRRVRGGKWRSWDGISTATVQLPWSREIAVFEDEIGQAIVFTGVFDVSLTETIYRITDPGDMAVDIGANVGYITSVMATRAGANGSVVAFEPHPAVFGLLKKNAERWDLDPETASVAAHRTALSSRTGTGKLSSHGESDSHLGLSTLEAADFGQGSGAFEVDLDTVDERFDETAPLLVKIDVEGHEHQVLQGSERLLSEGRIRDIVFEEHSGYPAPSMTLLEYHGMTLFTLRHTPLGPRLDPIRESPAPAEWPGPNYLATRDPERVLERLRPRGWQCLGGTARLGRRAIA